MIEIPKQEVFIKRTSSAKNKNTINPKKLLHITPTTAKKTAHPVELNIILVLFTVLTTSS